MFKKVLILLIPFVICSCSCTKVVEPEDNKLYLETKYYNEGNYIDVSSEEVNNIENETYLLFAYNNFCAFSVPCDNVFKNVMTKYNIDVLQIPFDDFKNTYLYETVKYAPSVIVVSNKKVIAYLDANKDEDISKYEDTNSFEEWLDNYINLNKR